MRLVALLSIGTCVFFAMGCASPTGDSANESSADTTTDGAHYVDCHDTFSGFTFEKGATEYTLKLREDSFKGQTLGFFLDSALAPDFFKHSTGNYIELTIHIPIDNVGCQFSATRDTVFSCGVYPFPGMPPLATITDGVSSANLDDTNGGYATEFRHVNNVKGEEDVIAVHFELFGPSHPDRLGYTREATFAPALCTTTRP
jgi:hypothetical protein